MASVGVGGRDRSLFCGVVAGSQGLRTEEGGDRRQEEVYLEQALNLQKLRGLCLTFVRSHLSCLEWDMFPLAGTICSPPVSCPLTTLWLFHPSPPAAPYRSHECFSSGLPSGSAFCLEHCSLSAPLAKSLHFLQVHAQTNKAKTNHCVQFCKQIPLTCPFCLFAPSTY